jgi:hypothetical protein
MVGGCRFPLSEDLVKVAKNGLSSHSSVFYQATLEDSQLSAEALVDPRLLILDTPE